MILLCVYLYSAQGGFSLAFCEPKTGLSPFHLAVLYILQNPRSLDQKKMSFSISLRWCFTPFALAQSTQCLCAKKWANPCHHGCVLQNSCLVQHWSYTTPCHPILWHMCYSMMQSSQSLIGGFLPIALTCLNFDILAVFDGVLHRIHFAQRVNEGFTRLAAGDQFCCSAKI